VSNKLDEIAHEAFPESDNAEGRCLAALQQAYDLGRAEAEAEVARLRAIIIGTDDVHAFYEDENIRIEAREIRRREGEK
jgi:hypothetical protein